MTDHNIKPTPADLLQWINESPVAFSSQSWAYEMFIAERAARWGSDVELKVCCDAIYEHEEMPLHGGTAEWLRNVRRPKPPSLKQQALETLEDANLDSAHYKIILRALEALPND